MSRAPISPWAITSLLMMLFLAAIDTTILVTAMPRIVVILGDPNLYHWAFTAFMLTSTLALPFYGKLADEIGIRRCMIIAGLIFIVGSAACGLAQNMTQLILGRAFQGLGAAGIQGLTMIAFGVLYSPEERGSKQSLISIVWGFSSLAGPVSGGYLVTYLSWRWIFGLNVILGLAALIIFIICFPRSAPQPSKRLDLLGSSLLIVSLTGLILLTEGSGEATILGYGVIGICVLGFVWQERRCPNPIIPPQLFSQPMYLLSVLIGFSAYFVGFSALTYIPFYLQNIRVYSPEQTGLIMTPMMLAWPVASAIAGYQLNKTGFRLPVLLGTSLCGIAMLAWFLIALGWQVPYLFLWCILLGAGMGCLTSSLMVAVQTAVAVQQIGIASATFVLIRNIGTTLGISLMGALQMQSQAISGLAGSLIAVFAYLAALGGISVVCSLLISTLSPAQLSQHSKING